MASRHPGVLRRSSSGSDVTRRTPERYLRRNNSDSGLSPGDFEHRDHPQMSRHVRFTSSDDEEAAAVNLLSGGDLEMQELRGRSDEDGTPDGDPPAPEIRHMLTSPGAVVYGAWSRHRLGLRIASPHYSWDQERCFAASPLGMLPQTLHAVIFCHLQESFMADGEDVAWRRTLVSLCCVCSPWRDLLGTLSGLRGPYAQSFPEDVRRYLRDMPTERREFVLDNFSSDTGSRHTPAPDVFDDIVRYRMAAQLMSPSGKGYVGLAFWKPDGWRDLVCAHDCDDIEEEGHIGRHGDVQILSGFAEQYREWVACALLLSVPEFLPIHNPRNLRATVRKDADDERRREERRQREYLAKRQARIEAEVAARDFNSHAGKCMSCLMCLMVTGCALLVCYVTVAAALMIYFIMG